MNSGAPTSAPPQVSDRESNTRRAPVQPLTHHDITPHPSNHLIPLSAPQPGEQYAFTVDLDRCSGCKACVSACHSLNGLDDHETWRDVGLLIGVSEEPDLQETPWLQTITSACHHCLDPACANGCPVLAYEKDPVTGIVRHLDDQCIGCQYCVLKCPYDVPKYSPSRGIVRKCDMCHSRLAAGQAPACAQACPTEAIRIDVVNQTHARAEAAAPDARLVPGVAASNYTLPSTRYRSSRTMPGTARSANASRLGIEHAHAPLVWMLVMTQAAAGLHLLAATRLALEPGSSMRGLAATAWALLVGGLLVGCAHLGRPLKAWRAFLGWRTSWMSREILLFSAYAPLATLFLLKPNLTWVAPWTALIGVVAVFSSAMIYIDTRRPAWSAGVVLSRFFGTVLVAGAGGGLVWSARQASDDTTIWACVALGMLTGAGLLEVVPLLRAGKSSTAPLHGMTRRLLGPLRWLWNTRIGLGAAAALMLTLSAVFPNLLPEGWAMAAWIVLMGGTVLERYGFFMACPAPRMPGGVEA